MLTLSKWEARVAVTLLRQRHACRVKRRLCQKRSSRVAKKSLGKPEMYKAFPAGILRFKGESDDRKPIQAVAQAEGVHVRDA